MYQGALSFVDERLSFQIVRMSNSTDNKSNRVEDPRDIVCRDGGLFPCSKSQLPWRFDVEASLKTLRPPSADAGSFQLNATWDHTLRLYHVRVPLQTQLSLTTTISKYYPRIPTANPLKPVICSTVCVTIFPNRNE